MATMNLLNFDLNGTNMTALAQTIIDDGWVFQEIPTSGNMNILFNNLFTHIKQIKNEGFFNHDPLISYGKGAIVKEQGIPYMSSVQYNKGNDPEDPASVVWDRLVTKADTVQPAGITFMFAGHTAPAGSLACDSRILVRADYPELFSAIGETWNSAGGLTAPSAAGFRIPPNQIGGKGAFIRAKTSNTKIGLITADAYRSHHHASKNHVHTANHNHSATMHNSVSHTHSTLGYIWSDGNAVDITGSSGRVVSADSGGKNGPNVVSQAGGIHKHNIEINTKTFNTGSAGASNTTDSGGGETKPVSMTMLLCIWTGKA